jgi:hypothetical protein
VRERAQGNQNVISLSETRKNLDQLKFHQNDPPNYALDYLMGMLANN